MSEISNYVFFRHYLQNIFFLLLVQFLKKDVFPSHFPIHPLTADEKQRFNSMAKVAFPKNMSLITKTGKIRENK